MLAAAAFWLWLLAPRGLVAEPVGDPVVALEAHQQALFDGMAPAVVFISNGRGFGSGVIVSSDGLLLTNRHVVGDGDRVQVVLHDGASHDGLVQARHDELDLALVRIASHDLPVLPWADLRSLRVGSWVASVGHGSGGIWTFSTGMVSNIYPSGSERPVFQTQIPLNPGSSGGPIVDRNGDVVGIVVAGMERSNSINFAIKGDVVLRAFEQLAPLCDCLVVTTRVGIPVFLDGAMVGKGPRVLLSVDEGVHVVFAVVDGQKVEQRVTWPEEREVTLTQ